jgi:hypothetical protein
VFGYSCEAKAEDLSLFVVQEATEMENGGQSLIVSDIQSVLNIFLSILLLISRLSAMGSQIVLSLITHRFFD